MIRHDRASKFANVHMTRHFCPRTTIIFERRLKDIYSAVKHDEISQLQRRVLLNYNFWWDVSRFSLIHFLRSTDLFTVKFDLCFWKEANPLKHFSVMLSRQNDLDIEIIKLMRRTDLSRTARILSSSFQIHKDYFYLWSKQLPQFKSKSFEL